MVKRHLVKVLHPSWRQVDSGGSMALFSNHHSFMGQNILNKCCPYIRTRYELATCEVSVPSKPLTFNYKSPLGTILCRMKCLFGLAGIELQSVNCLSDFQNLKRKLKMSELKNFTTKGVASHI